MAYQPQFQNDLFISYRRVANESSDRWVDVFQGELEVKLTELLGSKPEIWRDTRKLATGEIWREELAKNIDNAAIFLAVVSRSYFESDECIKEFDRFLGWLKDPKNGAMRRIFPILKQPPNPKSDLPEGWTQFDQLAFYRQTKGSEQFREFSPSGDPVDCREFWEKLSQLAQDLMRSLENLQQKGATQRRALGRVFLARVGPELKSERDRLRADLQQRGFEVVPQNEYFWNADGHLERITDDLEGSRLAVHLVARTASSEPTTPARTRTQIELANRVMKARGGPPPLVWIPPAQETHASMREIIDYVQHELADDGVQYWEGGFEDFKNQIYDKLPKPPPVQAEPRVAPGSDAGPRRIALLAEEGDIGALGPLKARLTDGFGIEPLTLKFSQVVPKDGQRLASTLARCNKAFVFWGQQGEDWLQDLLALPALESHVGLDRLAVYIAGPASVEKTVFTTTLAHTIRAGAADETDALASFAGQRPVGTP